MLMAALFFFYRDYRNEQTIAWIFGALGVLFWISHVNAWLAIVGLTTSFPLQDARLLAWTDAVGVDYRAILGWIAEQPKLGATLNAAYRLSVPMIFIVHAHFLRIALLAPVAASVLEIADQFLFAPRSTTIQRRASGGAGAAREDQQG